MSTYEPDCWVPILIETSEYGKVYRVLASWYGGYTGSDYWKLSSGVIGVSVSEDGGTLTIPQASGSVYIVSQNTHVSMLMASIFSDIERQADENGFTVKMITVPELLDAFGAK